LGVGERSLVQELILQVVGNENSLKNWNVLRYFRWNKSDLKDGRRDGESNKTFPLNPPSPSGSIAVELRLECVLRLHSLAPRGTSGERVGERGNPIKLSSSPRPSPPPSSEEREKTASVSKREFP
jgi:hypothetical protein